MHWRPSAATLRWTLAATVTGIGILAIGLSQMRTMASSNALPQTTRLQLGLPFRHQLAPGSTVHIAFTKGSLTSASRIYLLAISGAGAVAGQETLMPGAADLRRGEIAATVPDVSTRTAYWIALSPGNSASVTNLLLSRAGTELSATLREVPAGESVFLLGTYQGSTGPSAKVASYVPPAQCLPAPSTGSMIVCTFATPLDYSANTVSFAAYATGASETALPANNLPEVPVAAALPLVALLVGYQLGRRRRRAK